MRRDLSQPNDAAVPVVVAPGYKVRRYGRLYPAGSLLSLRVEDAERLLRGRVVRRVQR